MNFPSVKFTFPWKSALSLRKVNFPLEKPLFLGKVTFPPPNTLQMNCLKVGFGKMKGHASDIDLKCIIWV